MKPGAVIVDISIDQGGCFETSRPTTHAAPDLRRGGGRPLLRHQHARSGRAHLDGRAEQRDLAFRAGDRRSRLAAGTVCTTRICVTGSISATAGSRIPLWPATSASRLPRRRPAPFGKSPPRALSVSATLLWIGRRATPHLEAEAELERGDMALLPMTAPAHLDARLDASAGAELARASKSTTLPSRRSPSSIVRSCRLGGAILDLMSGWVSHLPPEIPYSRVVGVGVKRARIGRKPISRRVARTGFELRSRLAFRHRASSMARRSASPSSI